MKIDFHGIPRVQLGYLPTPLERAPNLTQALGGPQIWFKRDDLIGLGLGGNKVRKLEFLLAEALNKGADTVITTGAAQSNHARITAAAARKLGLRVVLVLRGAPDAQRQGNLLLDNLTGADVRLVRWTNPAERDGLLVQVAEEVRAEGGRPYIIPLGGSNGLGALGYVAAAQELQAQAGQLGLNVTCVITSSSSGGTQGGLALGAKLSGAPFAIWGISADLRSEALQQAVIGVIIEAARLLGCPTLEPGELTVFDGYVGPGYGIVTRETVAAIRLVAQTEGIFLDPVYTGKAMAGLVDLVKKGTLGSGQTVVFLHTGGTPALFAYQKELSESKW